MSKSACHRTFQNIRLCQYMLLLTILMLMNPQNCVFSFTFRSFKLEKKMSKQQLLTEECIDNGRDQESNITIPKNEPSVENLESEFDVKNELVKNGTYGETTISSLQNKSVKMIGLLSKIEPKVEPFESKVPSISNVASKGEGGG